MTTDSEYVLQMNEITKAFPGVLANNKISLAIRKGEVHGILGENGAGKSTLMKILYGLYHPDSGEISVNGKKVEIKSPRTAVELGIGMVHQHFMLVDNLSALENVLLGLQQENPPLLHKERARAKFIQLSREYDLNIDPDVPVWQLSVGEQQWLEILKLLFRDVQVLVLDEPTAVLAPAEAEKLFRTMRRLLSEGRSLIFISHKLDEVEEITDRITVLRDGCVVGTVNTKDTTPSSLAQMMVGRPISLDRRSRPARTTDEKVLVIDNLSCSNERGLIAIRDMQLVVHAGEIVGVAGVDGNGQKELAECITGLRKHTRGEIFIGKTKVEGVVRDVAKLGYIPEDRHRTGLILSFSVAENLIIKTVKTTEFTRSGIVQWEKVRANARRLIKEYDIKVPGPMTSVGSLSGGNQQRVVLARELKAAPTLLVCSQPTRGLDLGAVEALHEMLLAERNRGAAILFISTELSEVMALSDRIVVMYKGQIMGDVDGETASVGLIGEMMLGRKLSEIQSAGGVHG